MTVSDLEKVSLTLFFRAFFCPLLFGAIRAKKKSGWGCQGQQASAEFWVLSPKENQIYCESNQSWNLKKGCRKIKWQSGKECDFTDVKKTFPLCRPLWPLPFELAEEKQQCSDPRSPRVANLRDESDRPGNCSAAGNNAEADLPPTCLPCRLPPGLSWSSPAPRYGGAVLTTPRTAGWLHQVWNFHLSLRASLLNPDLWIFTHFTLLSVVWPKQSQNPLLHLLKHFLIPPFLPFMSQKAVESSLT